MELRPVLTPEIDKDWFHQKLAEKRVSLRGLARHMDIDPSAVSRMLSGHRKMKLEEATTIAAFLGSTVNDVLKHAGVAKDVDGLPSRILLAATINKDGALEPIQEPKPLPQAVIDRAHAATSGQSNARIVAAQVRALDGPLAFLDDAVLLFKPTDVFEQRAIGTLAICRSSKGEQIVAKIDRARKTGEARLLCITGKVKEVELSTATPVLAIIP